MFSKNYFCNFCRPEGSQKGLGGLLVQFRVKKGDFEQFLIRIKVFKTFYDLFILQNILEAYLNASKENLNLQNCQKTVQKLPKSLF